MGLFDSITHAVSTAVSSVVHTVETVEHKAADVVHDSVSSVEHAAAAVVHVASEAAKTVAHRAADVVKTVEHKAVEVASSAAHAVTRAAHTAANIAAKAAHTVTHAATDVVHAASTAVHTVARGAVDAAKAGARFLDEHSRGIAAALGTAALVTSFIPGVDIISPFLAVGAAGFSAYNTYKDVRDGASPFQTAFDAIGVLPGIGAGVKLAKVGGPFGKVAPLIGRFITAGRVGFTGGKLAGEQLVAA